ncbi:hypothetical protein [Geitlerinema calcuttense]|uniref:Uncharacterized protein n=1 Tax=Geitlerinema calcuttense NRMC-F 0142 TaxID=2922238 RepID=A0ABT7M1I1_9CYAN|nr:hypothetical protein [Geitlerinema calcuttense]MDL5056926.1 hypothetical protein [Geitlerinema calcuttense NRMC-F 0142]
MEYGIQETTKDTDWIIHLDDFENLVAFLCRQEKGLSGANWRISYRGIFGAPLSREYHQGGWTSHLAIWNHALAPEEHLDFFGRPPRVNPQLLKYESGLIASRSTVASMKKTDRQKDWPFVNGLAAQEWLSGEQSGLLHLRDLSLLRKAWGQIGKEQRQLLSTSRPLLNCIDDCSDILLERFLLIEKSLWERVNRSRYQIYQSEWKTFYRSWQKDSVGAWPTNESFAFQHERVLEAAERYNLPKAPLNGLDQKSRIYEKGCEDTQILLSARDEEIQCVLPPLEVMLP